MVSPLHFFQHLQRVYPDPAVLPEKSDIGTAMGLGDMLSRLGGSDDTGAMAAQAKE